MSKRPVPDEIMDAWLCPLLTQRAIRRDLLRYVRSVPTKRELLEWAKRQRAFDRPVVGARGPRLPPEHGRMLADVFPRGRLVEISDSYTLIPEDQPARLAAHIREFLSDDALDNTNGPAASEIQPAARSAAR